MCMGCLRGQHGGIGELVMCGRGKVGEKIMAGREKVRAGRRVGMTFRRVFIWCMVVVVAIVPLGIYGLGVGDVGDGGAQKNRPRVHTVRICRGFAVLPRMRSIAISRFRLLFGIFSPSSHFLFYHICFLFRY
jgi:hypothetical protein